VTATRRDLLAGGPHVSIGVNKADMLSLGRDLERLQEAEAKLLHIDVIDGVFCAGMTVGAPFVQAVARASDTYLTDVHLMVAEPLSVAEECAAAGADVICFQVEAARQPHRVLQVLGELDVVRGVAINPSTPLCMIEPLLDELDYVLVLTVNPGWSGQQMLAGYAKRLRDARALIGDRAIALGIDGAVTRENIAAVAAARPNVIVTGTAVFADGDPVAGVRFMHEQVANATR
jgi:ribulose-phosphate 3-epimerase